MKKLKLLSVCLFMILSTNGFSQADDETGFSAAIPCGESRETKFKTNGPIGVWGNPRSYASTQEQAAKEMAGQIVQINQYGITKQKDSKYGFRYSCSGCEEGEKGCILEPTIPLNKIKQRAGGTWYVERDRENNIPIILSCSECTNESCAVSLSTLLIQANLYGDSTTGESLNEQEIQSLDQVVQENKEMCSK